MAQGDDTTETGTEENLDRLNANLARMEELSKRMVAALGQKDLATDAGLTGPGQDFYMKAGSAYLNDICLLYTSDAADE